MALTEITLQRYTERSSNHEEEKCERVRRMIVSSMAASTGLVGRYYDIISQGSYHNNTNVRNESDVDICACFTDVLIDDYTYAPGESRVTSGVVASTRTYIPDQTVVGAALTQTFGSGMSPGNKAFEIRSNTARVDADVVAAWRFRGYNSRGPNGFLTYREGITFWTRHGQQIINFPEQHHRNGIEKNTRTGRAFKRAVRIVKRIRYDLLAQQVPAADGVSSFFIECAMYNMHDNLYTMHTTWKATVRDALQRMQSATDANEWLEVSEHKWLFQPTYHIDAKWTISQMQAFACAALRYLDT